MWEEAQKEMFSTFKTDVNVENNLCVEMMLLCINIKYQTSKLNERFVIENRERSDDVEKMLKRVFELSCISISFPHKKYHFHANTLYIWDWKNFKYQQMNFWTEVEHCMKIDDELSINSTREYFENLSKWILIQKYFTNFSLSHPVVLHKMDDFTWLMKISIKKPKALKISIPHQQEKCKFSTWILHILFKSHS